MTSVRTHLQRVRAKYAAVGRQARTKAALIARAVQDGYISIEAQGGFNHVRDVETSWQRAVEALHVLLEHWPASSTEDANYA